MRYSMLVYLTNMCKTLLEAEEFLRCAPADGAAAGLVEGGRTMLEQMEQVLRAHEADVTDEALFSLTRQLKERWGSGDADMAEGLKQLRERLSGGVSCQVRAVIFAELGEKWDALDSLYRFMRDDPRFDPVVVRTPVFRQVERDGKQVRETTYRDFLTELGIPSVDYREYRLEEDCPELAIISQPYEGVTLPQFWPENLAKQTRLVYVSYFVPEKTSQAARNALCEMPVYDHAWKVIGLNEKHFAFYQKYSHHGGANMLVTGLPKLDAAVRLRENGAPVPEHWRKKLEGKTVFLWNSWYDPNVSSLRYFEALMAWFAAHEDCALIWRPHPMTDTVTKLYFPPERYEAFQQCVRQVESAPNMLRDDQTACDAAFACSHAQLSDYSSLMVQYLFEDKPLLYLESSMWRFDGELVDGRWMERAVDTEGIYAFLERVRQGKDPKAALRGQIIARDLPLADGRCGERVCEALWDALCREELMEETP